jgi:hypothetical protein
MASLLWSDAILEEAGAIRAEVERRLAGLGIPGRLELTGAASMPGVLTKGDVDLHLRVTGPATFAAVTERLGEMHRPASPEAWAETLAVFEVPGGRPIGLAVTPVDSEHDQRFRRCWSRLRRDPGLLSEYNAMKEAAYGGRSYEALKSAFFTRIAAE